MSIADRVEMTLLWPATAREAAPAALRTRSCNSASDASVDGPDGAFPIPTTTIRSAVTKPAPGMVVTEPDLPVAPASAAACTASANAASSATGPSGPLQGGHHDGVGLGGQRGCGGERESSHGLADGSFAKRALVVVQSEGRLGPAAGRSATRSIGPVGAVAVEHRP